MRSTSTPRAPARAIAPRVPATPARSGWAWPPKAPMRKKPAKAPIMNTSLWAKLMSLRMPYTIVYPRATSAIIDPCASPVTSAFAIFISIGGTSSRSGPRSLLPRGLVVHGGVVGEFLRLDLHHDDGLVGVA